MSAPDRYRLIEPLGRGAQGEVWRIEDLQHGGTRRILKAVRGDGGRDLELIREFEALAQLDHPSLPRVRDLGRLERALGELPAGTPYFTADEIAGRPLLDAVVAVAEAEAPRLFWNVAVDVASALAEIHAAGLCHSDVTPANILVVGTGQAARAVLIDLGLSTARGARGAARGTLPYLPPEALAGEIAPAGDLYGLGASLYHAITGAPPLVAAAVPELVRAIIQTSPAPIDPARAPGVAGVVARLLAKAPEDRPPSALAVFDELTMVAATLALSVQPRPRPRVKAPRLVAPVRGAAALLGQLGEALERCWMGTGGVVLVNGPAGSELPAVVAVALREHQLRVTAHAMDSAPLAVLDGGFDRIADVLGTDPADADDGGRRAVARVLRAAASRARTVTMLDVTGDERAPWIVAGLAAAVGPGLIVVLVEGSLPSVPPGVPVARREPLAGPDLAAMAEAMLGAPPPTPWIESLARASRGVPAVAAAIVGALVDRGSDPLAADPERDACGADLDEIQLRQLVALPPGARRIATGLAIWDGPADRRWIAATIEQLDAGTAALAAEASLGAAEIDRPGTAALAAEASPGAAEIDRGTAVLALLDAGVVQQRGDELIMRSSLAKRVQAALSDAERRGWIEAAVTAAREFDLPPARWAQLLVGLPATAAQVAPLTVAAEDRWRRGQPAAAQVLAAAAARVPGTAGAIAAVLAASAATQCGDYETAIALASRATRELEASSERIGDLPAPWAARLVLARARQRSGDLAGAEALLLAATAHLGARAEIAGPLAKLGLVAGRHDDVERVVASVEPLPDNAAGALCAECSGSARLARGDHDGAERRFAEAERIAERVGDLALAGRARALRGMTAQAAGALASASQRYAEAAALSRAGGDIHAAAIAELNRGTVLAERGRHGAALPVLGNAAAALRALGGVAELAAAELDRGLSLLAVGELAAAGEAARLAEAAVEAAPNPHLAVFAALLAGDVARRRGDGSTAIAAYRRAAELARHADAGDRGHALRGLAEALAENDPVAAEAALAEVAASDRTADDRVRTLLVRGRLPRSRSGPEATELGDALADLGERAGAEDRLDRAWRADYLAAALAKSAGHPALAADRARRAAERHRQLAAETPAAWRAGLAADPDRRALTALLEAEGERRPPRPAGAVAAELEVARLHRLLALSRRLNAEPSLDRLLDEVIDTAIELTRGERGFLLLVRPAPRRGEEPELAVMVARGFAEGALADPAVVSRTIAARAVATSEPVITVDAGIDERFGAVASVAALRLRSVVAVPLRQKGRVIGCLYVDHHLRASAFDDEAASLVLELADIAAIAIENASLTADLRRQTAAVDELNRQLAAALAEREAELAQARAALPRARDALGPGFEDIIGDAPGFRAMLDVVQRAARVALPVVIIGESGTGKELVARALHRAGPRRERPFVAVNCGAMPEPLLESELFGHVRGAFTGADRDRKGVFEIADGGTLFLDEIADTGPAMQAKLLRVLQDGMVRRVGDETTRRVDVRVVAATQRPLAELVAAGRFREDLRFRLDVIAVAIPPLRARTGDLPGLVEHFLTKLRPDGAPRLTRAAWRALHHHAWPGNVRELENALACAVALGGDVLDRDDLPTSVTGGSRTVALPAVGDDLRLRPALDGLEREYLAAAMAKAGGNQTVAARLLGLSRFGLQKKLRRRPEPGADVDGE